MEHGPIVGDKPVKAKVTAGLPARFHCELIEYGRVLAEGAIPVESAKLTASMLARFIATDRGFAKARRAPK